MASSSSRSEQDATVDLEQVVPSLRQRLGPDATAGLVKLLDEAGEEWTEGVSGLVADRFERRLTEETSRVRIELANGLSAVRQEMAQGLAAVRQEIAQGNAELRSAIADQKFEILKWTFIFWTGQFFVTASFMVMLLRALRSG
jgi:hypothetical protein